MWMGCAHSLKVGKKGQSLNSPKNASSLLLIIAKAKKAQIPFSVLIFRLGGRVVFSVYRGGKPGMRYGGGGFPCVRFPRVSAAVDRLTP